MPDDPADLSVPSHLTVDGLEGRHARVELPDGTLAVWNLASLPRGVQEGDVVRLTVVGGDLDAEIDHAATARRRRETQALLDELNRGAPGGDLDL